jgi:hypothetical protein
MSVLEFMHLVQIAYFTNEVSEGVFHYFTYL